MTIRSSHRGAPALAQVRLLFGVALTVLFAGIATVASGPRHASQVDHSPAVPAGTVTLASLPADVVAGEPTAILLTGLAPSAGVDVLVAGSTGALGVSGVADADGQAWLGLPASLVAGRGTLTVHHGGRLLGQLDVRPGEPDEIVRPYVGPRTIPADTAHHTMVVAVPTDALGNPVAAGTPVTLQARRPDGSLRSWDAETNGLLAWERVHSGTVAGRTELRVTTPQGNGPVAAVIEVAGPPVEIVLGAPVMAATADGRTRLRVRTERLLDAFGNEVTDGVEVVFEVQGADGTGHQSSLVTAAHATVDIVAPSLPGRLAVTARIGPVSSAPLALDFAPVVDELPATVVRGRFADDVLVGPVLDVHGGWLPDGTEVTVAWGSLSARAQLTDGTAVLHVGHGGVPPEASLEVAVAGHLRQVTR